MTTKVSWYSPQFGTLKFNVDGDSQGKPGLAGIGGVLRNQKREVLFMYSKYIGIKDSNEAEVWAILEALCIYGNSFQNSYCGE